MLEQRVQQQFFESADLQYQAAETLSRPIADAAQAVFGCFTSGGKLLVAGLGADEALAALCVAWLVGRFERERPPLAALALNATLPRGLGDVPDEEALVRPMLSLGQPGDMLLLLVAGPHESAARALVDAAHQAEMSVVALGHARLAGLEEALRDTDVLVGVPHERDARVVELHLLVLHSLCDAIDTQLMGEQDPA